LYWDSQRTALLFNEHYRAEAVEQQFDSNHNKTHIFNQDDAIGPSEWGKLDAGAEIKQVS